MVEIALSLAIIAFALVAIIGVLPAGLSVQKDNSQETIITQDGMYLLDVIGKGTLAMDDLTNYFLRFYTNGQPVRFAPLNGTQIVGLLSTPKYELVGNLIRTNLVTAHVRSINGPAVTRDPSLRDFTFSYLLRSELTPLDLFPAEFTNFQATGLSQAERLLRSNQWRVAINTASNFHELRLTLQWPLFQTGNRWDVGNNSKTFRTLIPGQIIETNFANRSFFVQPGSFARVP